MLKSTSESLQHRAKHPGSRTDRQVGFGSKQKKRERHDAFKRIIAVELRWATLKLPSWVVEEIRLLGIQQWVNIQHKRSDDAARSAMKQMANSQSKPNKKQ